MPTKRKQQKREKHEAKRKAIRKAIRQHTAGGGKHAMLLEAQKWPVMECWLSKNWKDTTVITQIAVARRSPLTGEIRAGIYLVDLACLGVKNARVANFFSSTEFNERLLDGMKKSQPLIPADINLAAAIVKAGLDYAATLGFQPHKDYRLASILLQDADPGAVKEEIPVGGPDGKPFFISGPYDNIQAIIAKLTRKVGIGNFDYMAQIGPPTGDFDFDENWEEGFAFEDEAFEDDAFEDEGFEDEEDEGFEGVPDENIIEGNDIDWLLEDADKVGDE